MNETNIYKPLPDCQISNLAEIYLNEFSGSTNGVFVEIGAFDGRTVSNTCFLADLGWKGYYFEPVQEYALTCAVRHINNNVKVFPCGVSKNGNPISISVAGVLSSARNDHIEEFNKINWAKGYHSGNIRTVPSVKAHEISAFLPRQIELLVIDVEGMEPEIIDAWNFESCAPKLLIIETRDKDENFSQRIRKEYSAALDKLAKENYTIIQHDGCNVILSHQNNKAREPQRINQITF